MCPLGDPGLNDWAEIGAHHPVSRDSPRGARSTLLSVDPRLSWLRSFVAVAEELHFRTAAERLHLSTSALSRQVRLLEEAMQVELFRRTTRSVHLTDAGRALYSEIQAPVDTLHRALADTRADGDNAVRVGYTGAASTQIIPRLAAEWGVRDDVQLRLLPMSSSAQLEGLIDGRLHVGIHWEGPRSDQFEVVTLRTEAMHIALPAGHAGAGAAELPLCELEHDEWLMAVDASDMVMRTAFIERCEREGFSPRIRGAATGNEAQLTLVAAGHGVCLVPSALTGSPQAGVVFARLRGHEARLVAVARAPLRRQCELVLDALCRVAA